MIMEEKLRERLNQFMEVERLSVNSLAKVINVQTRTLNNQIKTETAIPATTLLEILFHYKNLSAEWLLRGDGPMYITDKPAEQSEVPEPQSPKITLELEVGNDNIIKMRLKDKVIQLAE